MTIVSLFEERWKKNIDYRKNYTHFDAPFILANRKKRIKNEFLSVDFVSKHTFYPFITTTLQSVKFKNVEGVRMPKKKPRSICYASHYDALLLSWYGFILQKYYDNFLLHEKLDKSSIAYRKLATVDRKTLQSRGMSNIDFANEVFDFVESNSPCVALTFDIENFFGSLDRKILKYKWKEVLGVSELPKDHYHIFKVLTGFQSIDKNVILSRLGIKGFKKKLARERGYIYDKEPWKEIKKVFFDHNLTIDNQRKGKGIPQGSAMSGVLSNIYMIDFDRTLNTEAIKYDSLYRRYSDDITIVCPFEHKDKFISLVYEKIAELNLIIQKEKEDRTVFLGSKGSIVGYYDMEDEKNIDRNSKGKYLCSIKRQGNETCLNSGCDFLSRCVTIPKKMQYLGFLFDGQKIEIRPGSMSNYHQRMISGVKKTCYQARGKNSKGPKVFKKKLVNKYTHVGSSNFVTYAQRAYDITGSSRIKKQYKNTMNKLFKLIDRYIR